MRLLTVTLWVLAGAALTGGAYWSFLITPESTIWSLAVSALLLLTTLFLAALTISGAIVGWRDGISTSHVRAAVVGVPAVIPAALIVALLWWLAGSATDRVTIYSGPINAWFIAAFGWDDVSWLFIGVTWLARWLTWVVAPMLAISLMAGIATAGWRALAGVAWITRALAPFQIGTATVIFAVLVAAPWVYLAPWRPGTLPATSVELIFIIAKLSVTAVLMAIGVALLIRQATSTSA
ncbi:MAG: hypothetical protein EXQ50_03930 [Acidobacteria bacterium]|nr:hypothetical protein [Acidobacteriota bacterium]